MASFPAQLTMTSFIHALNIGTLATWLSVAGFGAVGVMAPQWRSEPKVTPLVQAQSGEDTFTLAGASLAEVAVESSPSEAQYPAPPQPPVVTPSAPLPDVPSFPSVVDNAPAPTASNRQPRPAGKSTRSTSNRSTAEASNAARFAAGHMPERPYPAAARSRNQAGSVVVEFVAGSDGRVISARVKTPSPYPLLNEEAVRTVLGWSFPAGSVMTLERCIVFKLN